MHKWIIPMLVVLNLSAQMNLSTFIKKVGNENLEINAAYLKYEQEVSTFYSKILPNRPILSIERNEISSGAGLESANEKSVSITQDFQFPLNYYYLGKFANTDINIAYQTYLESAIDILNTSKNEAIRYVVFKQKMNLLKDFLDRYTLVHEQMKRQYKVGEISEMDYLRISIEYQQLIIEVSQLEKSIYSQKEKLKTYLASFDGELADTLEIDNKLNKETLLTEYHAKLPTLERSKQELEQSDTQITSQYLNRLPNFSFTYREQEISNISYSGFDFGLSIPLWIPKEFEEVELSYIQRDLSTQKVNSVERNLTSFIDAKWNESKLEFENWNRYKSILVPSSEKVFSTAKKQYEGGEISYFEFIDNYRIWKNTRISELDQKLTLLLTQSDLTKIYLLKFIERKQR
jgi:cobalt-zinc-cadmium resistance protein CzcA